MPASLATSPLLWLTDSVICSIYLASSSLFLAGTSQCSCFDAGHTLYMYMCAMCGTYLLTLLQGCSHTRIIHHFWLDNLPPSCSMAKILHWHCTVYVTKGLVCHFCLYICRNMSENAKQNCSGHSKIKKNGFVYVYSFVKPRTNVLNYWLFLSAGLLPNFHSSQPPN